MGNKQPWCYPGGKSQGKLYRSKSEKKLNAFNEYYCTFCQTACRTRAHKYWQQQFKWKIAQTLFWVSSCKFRTPLELFAKVSLLSAPGLQCTEPGAQVLGMSLYHCVKYQLLRFLRCRGGCGGRILKWYKGTERGKKTTPSLVQVRVSEEKWRGWVIKKITVEVSLDLVLMPWPKGGKEKGASAKTAKLSSPMEVWCYRFSSIIGLR